MKLLDGAIVIIIALMAMLSAEFILKEVEFQQDKVVINEK